MKSIKQQYIDLTEGRMSQTNFMRNLRMTMPQYVTNVTSFKDAVRILRNKGILTEAKTKLTADQANPSELRMGIRVEMEHTDDPKKAEKIALDHLAENPFYYTQLKLSGVDTKATPSKEKKAIAKKKDETEMVDKANQMKTPKGVEKIKASANKAKKETNKPEKGIKMMSLVSKTVRGVKKMDATGEKMKKIHENLSQYDNMSDYEIIKWAEQEGIEDSVVLDGEGGLANREEILNLLNNTSMPVSQKVDVPGEIFKRNANITRGLNRIAGIEENKIREAIRKMIKQEMFDGRDNMTDVAGHQLDENQNNKYILTDEDGLPYLNSEVVAQYLKSVIDPEEIESVDVFINDHEGWGESSMYFFDVPDETPEATEEEVEKFAKQEMSYWLTSKPDEFPHKY